LMIVLIVVLMIVLMVLMVIETRTSSSFINDKQKRNCRRADLDGHYSHFKISNTHACSQSK
jgi:hypothetical protein